MSSQAVDQRVVQMEFDNRQFEANAKETISTLDKLKQSLKLEDSAKSFNELSKSAGKVDLSSLSSNLSSISDRFSTFGVIGMTAIQRITNAVMDLGSNLVGKLMTPLNIIKSGGWARALNIENAMFKMSGLLKDEFESQRKTIDETIDYAVSGTAYSYDAAASAMSQLMASGVEFRGESEDMRKALRGISGTAAMTGASFEDIAHVFTRVAGNGRIMAIDLQSLSGRGLNAAATLAEQLNVTESEVRELVRRGQIDFQTFANAMDDAFGEHAKKANETFTGAFDNIKAALKRTGQGFGQIMQTSLRDIFNSIRPNINAFNKDYVGLMVDDFDIVMKAVTKKVQDIFGDENTGPKVWLAWVPSAVKSAENIFLGLVGIFGAVRKAFDGIFPKANRAKVTIFWSNILAATTKFRDTFTSMKSFADPFIKVVEKASDKVEEVTKSVEDLEEIAHRVISGEFGNGEVRFKALEELGYNYKLVQNKVNELLGSSYRYELTAEELAQTENELTDSQKEGVKVLSTREKKLANLENRFHSVAEAEEKIADTVEEDKVRYDLLDNITDTAKIFASVLRIIGSAGEAIMKVVVNPFLETGLPILLEKILSITGAIGRKLEQFADYVEETQLFEKILQGIINGFKFLYGIIQNIVSVATQIFNSSIMQFVFASIRQFLSSIPDMITGAINAFKSFWDSFIDLPAVRLAIIYISRFVRQFLEIASINLNKLSVQFKIFKLKPPNWQPFLDVLNSIIGGLIKVVKWLYDGAKGAVEFIAPFAGSIGTKVIEFFKTVPGLIKELLTGEKPKFEIEIPNVEDTFGKIKTFGQNLYKRVKKFFEDNLKWEKIGGFIQQAAKLAVIAVIVKLLWNASHLMQTVDKTAQSFRSAVTNVNKALQAYTANLKADIILKIAEAVGILALVLVGLCLVPTEKLTSATAVMFVTMMGIKGIIDAFAKVSLKRTLKISSVADAFKLAVSKFTQIAGVALLAISVTGSLLLFVLIIKMIIGIISDEKQRSKLVDAAKELIKGFLLLAAGATILMGIAAIFEKLGKVSIGLDLIGLGVAMIGLSAGLFILSFALNNFSEVSWNNLSIAGLALSALILGMAALARVVQEGGALKAAVYFVAMAAALNLLIIPLKTISDIYSSEGGEQALIWFAGIMGTFMLLAVALAGFSTVVDEGSMLKIAAAVILLSASLAVIAATLMIFDKFDAVKSAGELLIAFGLLSAAVLVLSVVAALAKSIALPLLAFAGSMALVGVGVLAFAAALWVGAEAIPAFFEALAKVGDLIDSAAPQIIKGFAGIVIAIAAGIIVAKGAMALAGSSLITAMANGLLMASPTLLTNIGVIILLGVTFLVDLIEAFAPKVVDGIIRTLNAIANALESRSNEMASAIARVLYAIFDIIVQVTTELFIGLVGWIYDMLKDIPGIGKKLKELGFDPESMRAWGDRAGEALRAGYLNIGTKGREGAEEAQEEVKKGWEKGTEENVAAIEEGAAKEKEAVEKGNEAVSEAANSTYNVSESVTEEMSEAAGAVREGGQEIVNETEAVGEEATGAFHFDLSNPIFTAIQNADGSFDISSLMETIGASGMDLTKIFGENFDLTSVTGDNLGNVFSMISEANPDFMGSLQNMLNISPENLDYSSADDVGVEYSEEVQKAIEEQASNPYGAQALVDANTEVLNKATVDADRAGEATGKTYGDGMAAQKDYVKNSASEITGMVINELNKTPEEALAVGEKTVTEGWNKGVDKAQESAKTSGANVKAATLTGMTDTKKEFSTLGTTQGTDYVSGISSKEESAKTAGTGLKNKAVEGSSNSYEPMYDEGYNAGEGYYDGVDFWADRIATKAKQIVENAVKEARKAQDSASPSKKFRQLGSWAGEGYVIGIESLGGQVTKSAASLANNGLIAMQGVVDKIYDVMDSNIDYEPTIRPVMDLSNIEDGAALVNDTFSRMNSYIPVSAINATGKISNIGAGHFASSDMDTSNSAVPGTVNNFTQNNYSPKALSRLEIYRQTRNMFAMMKGQANA